MRFMSYIPGMMDFKGFFISRRGRAIAGAVFLHAVMFILVANWQPTPLPVGPQIIPIVLIELPALEPEVPIAVIIEPDIPEPETPQETPQEDIEEPEPTQDLVPEPEPQPEATEDRRDLAEQEHLEERANEEVETAITAEPAPLAGISLADASADKNQAEQVEAADTPPQFVYKFDPFAETAPTTMARFSRAINCSRANRETRPAFCPNYDEDDVYLASITQNRPSEWEQVSYDPVLDIAVAQSAFGHFQSRQLKPHFNGASESFDKKIHFDEALPDKDCRHISYGFEQPGVLDANISPADSRTVFCYQSLEQ